MVRLTILATAAATAALVSEPVLGDIYLHNPRGSNNRNCRTDNNTNRRNNNRLFDSQNNAKGGYSCPRAYPFPCYALYDPKLENQQARTDCNELNSLIDPEAEGAEEQYKAMVDETGVLHPDAINTPMQYYYAGTDLSLEWTNQHGMGTNNKLHSDVIIQYACMEDLQDNCGIEPEEEEVVVAEEDTEAPTQSGTTLKDGTPVKMCKPRVNLERKLCKPRDGFAVNNGVKNNRARNSEGNGQIETGLRFQDDYRYGRHEGVEYRQECYKRERNKGLYTADQKLGGNTAEYTRKNPGGDDYGLECPEEAAYWPYWHHSPWKDVAIITSNMTHCEALATESQNVAMKGKCDMTGVEDAPRDTPNNERTCVEKGGSWCMDPAHGLPTPQCIEGQYNRQNHLGNVGGGTNTNQFNWTIPTAIIGQQCVLRVRYNISTGDFGSISVFGDSKQNDDLSPLKDRNNNEVASYRQLKDGDEVIPGASFGFAVNTNQAGRTFQDRTYMFEVKERPKDRCRGTIHNLQTRGKRGNIVQTYPSVEYDFAPQILEAHEGDCVHVQFVGSDYNPNRAPNNGEGGPPKVDNSDNYRSDRHNLVQTDETRSNSYVRMDVSKWDMFKAPKEDLMKLAFVGQDIGNPEVCKSPEEILELGLANRNEREGTHYNCAKLSGVKHPYFDAGLFEVGAPGTYTFMSTRNNNFSNRGQKGVLIVKPALSALAIAGIATGVTVTLAMGGVALASVMGVSLGSIGMLSLSRKKNNYGAVAKPSVPLRPASSTSVSSCVAIYDHEATETGELEFKIGDKITVTKKDQSGWWEGHKQNGERGIFPHNYVEEK